MGSMRGIRGENLKEQNRIRSLIKKGTALSKMTEEEFVRGIDELMRRCPVKLPDFQGERSQKEVLLLVACLLWESYRSAEHDLITLFGLPEDWYSKAPPVRLLYLETILDRAKKHGCVGCKCRDDGLCTKSAGDEAIPNECPGFE